jgi:uncharacterized protein YjiK
LHDSRNSGAIRLFPHGDIYEYEPDGTSLRPIDLADFDGGPEAITYRGEDLFAIHEEDNLRVTKVELPTDLVGHIDQDGFPDFVMSHANLTSPEGLSWDEERDQFYVANESPPRIFRVGESGGTVEEFNITGLSSAVDDISDIHFVMITCSSFRMRTKRSLSFH